MSKQQNNGLDEAQKARLQEALEKVGWDSFVDGYGAGYRVGRRAGWNAMIDFAQQYIEPVNQVVDEINGLLIYVDAIMLLSRGRKPVKALATIAANLAAHLDQIDVLNQLWVQLSDVIRIDTTVPQTYRDAIAAFRSGEDKTGDALRKLAAQNSRIKAPLMSEDPPKYRPGPKPSTTLDWIAEQAWKQKGEGNDSWAIIGSVICNNLESRRDKLNKTEKDALNLLSNCADIGDYVKTLAHRRKPG